MKKKNSKIKNFFKDVFSTKKTKIAFFACLLSCLLLIGVTFAWFYSVIELPQSEIKTGTIEYVVKGYDSEGNFISTIIDPKKITEDTVNPNAPLFNLDNISANKYTTAYISIETTGTLDMEYSLTLNVNGSDEDIQNVGGFWFKVEELVGLEYDDVLDKNGNKIGDKDYDALLVDYSPVLGAYARTDGGIIECSQECIDNGSNLCTEHSDHSRNLITVNTFAAYGQLTSVNKVAFYRIDVGLKATSTPERYANTNLKISGEVYGTQLGGITNTIGYGNIYKVSDSESLNKAIENALPGDAIQLISPIIYRGDLVFNKCISLVTYGNDLTIYGNLVYDFVSSYNLKINLSSGGQIKVLKENGAGGDFQITTPNSAVTITGNNYTTNIYVEDDAVFKVTNAPSTSGLLLSGANILNKDGDPKDVDVNSNSRITVDYGASLSRIEAVANSSCIEIVNYGTIGTINLSKMQLIDSYPSDELVDTGYAQIVIDNYSRINESIQLPNWSRPYVLEVNEDGYYEGNTLIYRRLGADEMAVLDGLCPYKTVNIIDFNAKGVCVMQKVNGKNDKLIVYYGNRLDELTQETQFLTVEDLLVEYFVEYYNFAITEEEALEYVNTITYLEVLSLTDVAYDDGRVKCVTAEDLQFMNGMERLNSINLEQATIVDNKIPAAAFKNNKVLTSIKLPNNIERIESEAFNGSGVISLRLPSSVTYYHMTAITTLKYLFFDSLTPLLPEKYNAANFAKLYFFVNEAVLSDYRTKFNIHKKVFVDGEVTDDELHVVREGVGGYELICYSGNGADLKIGTNLILNGELITITSIKAYAYSNITVPFKATLESTITSIEGYAFYGSSIDSIDCNNVRTIGPCAFYSSKIRDINLNNVTLIDDYAFYLCNELSVVDTKSVETIGNYAFASCSYLFEVNCPNVISTDTYAFASCINLMKISFHKLRSLGANSLNTTTHTLVSIYFYNDDFNDCSYGNFIHNGHDNFRVFVRGEVIEDFISTGFVSKTIVYPIGDIVGEYILSKTTKSGFTYSLNIGEYVVSKDEDNVTLITYNIPEVNEDFTIPGTATIIKEDGTTVTKNIATVGSYCFRRTRFSEIKLTFPDSITRIETYGFYGHANAYYPVSDKRDPIESTYFNRITEINFNNLKYIGDYAFYFFKNITEIKNNKIEEIGIGAFKSCNNIFTVDLPCIKIIGREDQAVNNVFGMNREIVSIKLGPNLEKIYGDQLVSEKMLKFRELIIEAEITSDDYNENVIIANYYYSYNKDFRVFVPYTVVKDQRSSIKAQVRELGEKTGERIVTNSSGLLSYNLGKYVYREVAVDEVTGVCLTSYNYEKVQSDFSFPHTINGQDVIRLGYACFRNMNFSDAPTLNESGEHLLFTDKLLEIGQYALSGTTARFSEFPGLRYLDDYSINNSSNIYMFNAPELLTAGKSIFHSCPQLKIINAPKLHTVGTLFTGSSNPLVLYTDIQVSGDNTWLSNNKIKDISFATTENSEFLLLSGTAPTNIGRSALTNSEVATKYVNNNTYSYGIFSQDEFVRSGEYIYYMYDEYGNTIYSTQLYEYLVNKDGDEITIYRGLIQKYNEDVFIPSVIDGRVVTTIFQRAFMNSNFNSYELKLGDTITEVQGTAFRYTNIGGTLNLNNVYLVGSSAFASTKIEVLNAPNLKQAASEAFGANSSLISVYMNKFESYNHPVFNNCPNIKYYYTEVLPTFNVTTVFSNKTDMTFVLNVEVDDASDIITKNWNVYKNATIYVPYQSLEIYESIFETSTYSNFSVEPYGYVITDVDTGDVFILEEQQGNYIYDEETQSGDYEIVLKLNTCLTTNDTVEIPSVYNGLKITIIDEKAFNGQIAIKNIILPKHLYKFGDNTFHNVTNLASLSIDSEAEHYSTLDGVLYTKDYNDLVHYPKAKTETIYTIKEGTKIIRSNAFANNLILKELIIPSSVIIIGEHAFTNTSIDKITFESDIAPYVTGNTLFDDDSDTFTIYIPKDSIVSYRSVNAFAYVNIVEME